MLLLSERVDEWLVSNLHEFEGKPLASVARGELDLGGLADEEKKAREAQAGEYKGLVEKIKEALGDRVKEVRITHRLTDSPCCLVADEHDPGGNLARILKSVGQKAPDVKPILEINPDHAMISRLKQQEAHFADWSKLLFDQVMRQRLGPQLQNAKVQVAGFRYFNVYGPHEQHKGRMASVAYHQFHQFRKEGLVKLFADYGGYAAGEQMRDFVFVDDVVAVNLWFFDHPEKSGIFNLGSGRAQSFNEVASAVVNTLRVQDGHTPMGLNDIVAQDLLQYIPFPDALRGKYQCFTEADLGALRGVGCAHQFADVQTGVSRYVQWLAQTQ